MDKKTKQTQVPTLIPKNSHNQVHVQTPHNQSLRKQTRCAGVLLHISSLPAGDFGADAIRFVDFLAKIGATVWQTLPLNMPHDDGSPYQCLSAHAGNPAFISLESLVEKNLLTTDDLIFNRDGVPANRQDMLAKAYFNYKHDKNTALQHEYVGFCHERRRTALWPQLRATALRGDRRSITLSRPVVRALAHLPARML